MRHRRSYALEALEPRRLFANATFVAPVALATAGKTSSVATGDFNNDDLIDIVSVNPDSNSVSVFINKGANSFKSAVNLTTGARPTDVLVADLNGDGALDIAVAQAQAGSVGVFLGFDNGQFDNRQNFLYGSTSSSTATDYLAIANLNGDSRIDLVVSSGVTGKITTMLGTNTGFVANADFTLFSPGMLAIGDFDDNGYSDIAVLSGSTTTLYVFYAIGNGSLSSPDTIDFGSTSETATGGLVAIDMNNNNRLDLVAGSRTSSGDKLNVILMDVDNPVVTTSIPLNITTGALATGDFNNDNEPDLLVNKSDGTSDIIHGVSTAAVFDAPLGLTLQTGTWSRAGIADFGTDTKRDIAAPNGAGSNTSGTVNFFRNSTGEIVKFDTVTTVTSNANPANFGDSVTFTINVTGPGGVPGGRVLLFNGSRRLATLDLDGAGQASFTTAALLPGNLSISARYLGSTLANASTSAVLTQSIVTTPTHLVGSVLRYKLPSIVVPGDVGSVVIAIKNEGGTLARGLLGIQLFASTDGTISGDDVQLTAAKLASFGVGIKAGVTKAIGGTFVIPSNITPGSYQILAKLVAGTGIAESDVVSDPILVTNTTAALSFGTLAERRGVRLVKNFSDGSIVTYLLSGPGTGTISENGDGSVNISLTGTSVGSALKVVVKGGNRTTPIGNITSDSALGVVVAPQANVSGAIQINGDVRQIVLGNVSNSSFTLNGSIPAVMVLQNVSDTSITSTAPINALKVASWSDNDSTTGGTDDSISAPWINAIVSRGQFPVDLNLSGANAPRNIALRSIVSTGLGNARWAITGSVANTVVRGSLDGTFVASVTGDWTALAVTGGVTGNFSASVGGLMKVVSVVGDFKGDFAAANFTTIAIKGNATNARFFAGANFGSDGTLDGNNDTFGVGNIITVSVRGTATSSVFAAGLNPTNGQLFDGDDVVQPGGLIRAAVFGGLSDDSRVLAETLPKRVRVAGVAIDPLTDPRFKL